MNLLVIVIIVATAIITQKGLTDPIFFNKYKFKISAIAKGEKIRLLTSGFLHVDWTHFIFNMLTLYFFADVIIHQFGKGIFILIYIFSLVLGNLVAYRAHKNQPNYSAVGASGAVIGIVYAGILLNPLGKIYLYFFIGIPAFLFGILYLVYSVYGIKQNRDLIGHAAHFGGAVAGIISILLFAPHYLFNNVWISLAMMAPIGYFIYQHYLKK